MFTRPALVLLTAIALSSTDLSSQSPTLTSVMNQKADDAQRLLRPLVTGDFVVLDRYAERLGRLTYTEVASWQAHPEPHYLKQATAFITAVQGLREAARHRDREEVSVHYAALVSSCVQCHLQAQHARPPSLRVPGSAVVVPPRH
jgi:hypothetical protein